MQSTVERELICALSAEKLTLLSSDRTFFFTTSISVLTPWPGCQRVSLLLSGATGGRLLICCELRPRPSLPPSLSPLSLSLPEDCALPSRVISLRLPLFDLLIRSGRAGSCGSNLTIPPLLPLGVIPPLR